MGEVDTAFRTETEGMTLKDLIYIKKLGEGQFGHVFLVYSKSRDSYFALKAISKAQIIDQNLEKHTVHEKSVLALVNFPLIIKMYRTFKDENYVYFL
jgi:cGMP-dependent protein kinase